MKSLQQFKTEANLSQLQLMKSNKKENGCQWAETPLGDIFLSPKTDTSKPLFVIVNDGSVNAKLEGTLWIVNANVSLGTIL